MGYKTRTNYAVGVCMKVCENEPKECPKCVRFSKYQPKREDERKRKESI